MKKMNKKGFTIVELVIVIAVIAVLAGVLIPTFGGIIEKAEISAFEQEAKNALTADLLLVNSRPENGKNTTYKATTDATADATKEYYKLNGDEYEKVTPSDGDNPKAEGWYEVNTECQGTFSNVGGSDYTYTYTNGEYTITYATGSGWGKTTKVPAA